MKMNLKKISFALFIALILVIAFIRVDTNFYIGGDCDVDVQLRMDNQLIFDDDISSFSFLTKNFRKPLRYGFHKIQVSSKKANINQEKKIFLFPNQHIYIEFFPADTLTFRHYNFPDSMVISGIQLTDSMIEQYKLPKELDSPIENEKSRFFIKSRFNPFYLE
jgi:hypothetical protein